MLLKPIIGLILLSSITHAHAWSYSTRNYDGEIYNIRELSKKGQFEIESEGLVEDRIIVNSHADLNKLYKALESNGIEADADIKRELSKRVNKSFRAPNTADLIDTGLSLSKEAIKTTSAPKSDDCDKDKTPPPKAVKALVKIPKKKIKEKEYICECQIPKGFVLETDEDKTVSFLGKIVDEEYSLITGNDNFLHGGYRQLASDKSGDDRGRTFSIGTHYKLVGEKGELRINLDSVGFSRLYQTAPGSERYFINENGDLYQDFLERDTLDISLRKKFEEDAQKYLILGGELEHNTDEGMFAQAIQDQWHSAWNGADMVQYENIDHMENKTYLKAYGGVGKEWLKDLGNWKCKATAESTIKVSTEGFGKTELGVRADAQISSGTSLGRNKDNPWLTVALWAEGNVNLEGEREENAGIEISTSTKVNNWKIKPFIGMNYHNEKEDKLFGLGKDSNEPEHVLGIRISRPF